MEWLEILKAFRELADTKTAYVMFGCACFYVGNRLQKKLEEFATKTEFRAHRQAMYVELAAAKGEIRDDLKVFHDSLQEHNERDERRFEILDTSWTPQLKVIDDKFNKAAISLAKIRGALGIKEDDA